MKKHVTPQLYAALKKLYPERNVFTELQVKSVQDWLHASSRSEPQLHLAPVTELPGAPPMERAYYIPSTVLSRSGSIGTSLEAKLSEVHRQTPRLTDAVAFQFNTDHLESTEPSDLSKAEQAEFYLKLLAANKTLREIAQSHDDLFDQGRITDERALDEAEIFVRHDWIRKYGIPARERAQALLNEVAELFSEPSAMQIDDVEPPQKRRSTSNDDSVL